MFDTGDPYNTPALTVDVYLVAACDVSMPRKSYHSRKKLIHYWTHGIADLRKITFVARHLFQRTRKRRSSNACTKLEHASRDVLKFLKITNRKSQEEAMPASG